MHLDMKVNFSQSSEKFKIYYRPTKLTRKMSFHFKKI